MAEKSYRTFFVRSRNDRILVAALDWGIGHASRCIPVIRFLIQQGCTVTLASSGNALKLLKETFPEIRVLEKPAYNIFYSKSNSQAFAIFIQVPKIILTIIKEHWWLKKISKQFELTEVISDNCYGLWNKKIDSVFITHQLNIKCPGALNFLEPVLRFLISLVVMKYDSCLIPDTENEKNFSGELSHGLRLRSNTKYIGTLSRFETVNIPLNNLHFDVILLLSGPEPQRSIFENKCAQLLIDSKLRSCIIRGLPGNDFQKENTTSITWHNHLPDEMLIPILKNSTRIICRPGYSTIMDLVELNLKAILVPTPGQTEQEYLAQHNAGNKLFTIINQDELSSVDFETEKICRVT